MHSSSTPEYQFSGTKRKKKNVLLTDVRGGGFGVYNIPLYRVFITIISFKLLENIDVMFKKYLIQKVKSYIGLYNIHVQSRSLELILAL